MFNKCFVGFSSWCFLSRRIWCIWVGLADQRSLFWCIITSKHNTAKYFWKRFYIILMYYNFVFMAFFDRNLLPCSQQRFSYVYGDQGNVLWIACVWKFELWIIIWEATNHKFDAFHALEYKIPCLILFHVTVVLKYCPKTIKSGNRLQKKKIIIEHIYLVPFCVNKTLS